MVPSRSVFCFLVPLLHLDVSHVAPPRPNFEKGVVFLLPLVCAIANLSPGHEKLCPFTTWRAEMTVFPIKINAVSLGTGLDHCLHILLQDSLPDL